MTLDPSIILGGQPVNVLGAMQAGNDLAKQHQDMQRQNALSQLYQTQGAGIMNGDPGALNALAAYDPAAAMGIKQSQQETAFGAEKMQMLRDEAAQKATEWAMKLSDSERQQHAATIERGVAAGMAAKSPQEWDALMQQMGAPELVGKFDQRQGIAYSYMGVADALKAATPDLSGATKGAPSGYLWNDPNDPSKGVSPISGFQPEAKDDYQRYVQEEKAAGRSPLDRLGFEQAKKGKGFSVTTADGTTVQYGGGSGPNGETVNYDPREVGSVLDSIDAIAGDPSLENVVGPIIGGGGNNIDDLNMAQRAYYGGDGLALIEKIGQLQNTTWLAARQMLKGGGAITDYESRKAEGAMARLSRAKGLPEFRAALKDLRDAITEGQAKLQAAQGQQSPQAAPQVSTSPATGSHPSAPAGFEDIWNKY